MEFFRVSGMRAKTNYGKSSDHIEDGKIEIVFAVCFIDFEQFGLEFGAVVAIIVKIDNDGRGSGIFIFDKVEKMFDRGKNGNHGEASGCEHCPVMWII